MKLGGWLRAGVCVGVGGALALASGCGSEAGETIPIGAVFSTSGALAEQGVAQLEAVRLAVDEINAAGGVKGKSLKLVYRDDGADANKTQRAAQALRDEGVPVVIGSTGSRYTADAAKLLLPSAVMISGSATSPSLTTLADEGFLFRTCASDEGEGKLLAQRATQRGLTRVAIIHSQQEPGLVDAFAAAFTAQGGTVTLQRAYERDPRTHGELLRDVFASEPEAVLLDADPVSGADLILEYIGGFVGERSVWLFTHTLETPSFVTAVGAHRFTFPHEGTGPGTPMGHRYQSFASAYEASFGEPTPVGAFTANAYDAVYLAALAMEKADSLEPAAIRDALPQVSFGGLAFGPSDYADAVEAIRGGRDINFEGASGSVDLDPRGDTTAPFDVWEIKDSGIHITERAVRAPL